MSFSAPVSMAGVVPPRRHHMVIAGTGRAGTSFLVRFLTALGLDTHLSRYGEHDWDDAAQAGLEDCPPSLAHQELPYVLKSPWTYQFIEETLAAGEIEIDAAILPVRDLFEAAASRTIVELRAYHERAPWAARLSKTWEDFAVTPGGSLFSLNPVDQARLLAVGFYQLIERLVEADVPLVFVAFPRLVEDADYLFGKLSPVLPPGIGLEQARQSHRQIANAELVRVGRELQRNGTGGASAAEAPSFTELDNIALRRELLRLRARLRVAEGAVNGEATGLAPHVAGGSYRVEGTNANGSPYCGVATLTPRGDATFAMVWNTGSVSAGICRVTESGLAASYVLNGKAGLVLYQPQPDGSLRGTWSIAGQPGQGIETLIPVGR